MKSGLLAAKLSPERGTHLHASRVGISQKSACGDIVSIAAGLYRAGLLQPAAGGTAS